MRSIPPRAINAIRKASRVASFSLVAAALLAACTTQTPRRGRGGRAAASNVPGVEVRKYRFEETGEMLEYAVYVSSKVKKGTKSPLVILLHGRGVGPTSPMRAVSGPAERAGFIVAAPMGYNERGWYGEFETDRSTPPQLREYSEKDVMNVLGFMRAEFDVDEDRIYVMGSSMGGAGALYLAVKHPHLWAAVAAGAPPIPSNSETITNFAAIRHMPVIVVHGDNDALVNVGVSRRLVNYMKELGMTYEYREIPGGTHPNAIGVGAPWMISFLERHTKASHAAAVADTSTLAGQRPPKVRIDGAKASQLISLLSSGSGAIKKTLAEPRQGWVMIRDLRVLSEAASKGDSISPSLKAPTYKAWGKIGDERNEVPIGEAASLWKFLEDVGFSARIAVEGSYIEISTLDCMINATARLSAPRRFSCNIAGAR